MKIGILPDTYGCICGAMPYDPDTRPDGHVGMTRYRKPRYCCGGGYSVTCTQCGRVGERGRTQAEAAAKWAGHLFKYGPQTEVDT